MRIKLCFFSSLSDNEYEIFVLILINGRTSLSYNEMTPALVNHELRKKDKEFLSTMLGESLSI